MLLNNEQRNETRPDNVRESALALDVEQFRQIGYQLIDSLCEQMGEARHDRLVRPQVNDSAFSGIHSAGKIPELGSDAAGVFKRFTKLLIEQGVSTAHPRFFAYIMGAASDVSVLSDFLASAINPPLTSSSTSPLSTMIEAQTIQWMAQLLGFSEPCGGLFVSGGSIANLIALKAALHTKEVLIKAKNGISELNRYRIYVSHRAHSSIPAAADLCGLGQEAITYVDTTLEHQLDLLDLAKKITSDTKQGLIPLMVVGIAGCTSLGIVDPLIAMSKLCQENKIWFHVDAAYGGLAIVTPQAPKDLLGLRNADSVTIDPHKWMYAAADVGCILTRSKEVLFRTFSQEGSYYSADAKGAAEVLQFRDLGPQTTRSFRALKVRMSLEIAGKQGYQQMISDDIALAGYLFQLASQHDQVEACTCHLSITTLRFFPRSTKGEPLLTERQLNDLNKTLLAQLQQQGECFPSHTVHEEKYLLRVCIVNLNTVRQDIERLFNCIVNIGSQLSQQILK